MGRIFKAIIVLVILAGVGIAGYAYLGDMQPDTAEQRLEVDLNGGD
ncbi:MAG: hypothetical protein KDJ82_10155 [Rhodobacteraceae bacterium]|jgi:hypothetical protein|nr:hypothetical protein [Paracoccaceae bacterium]